MKKVLLVFVVLLVLGIWWFRRDNSASNSSNAPVSTQTTVTKTPFIHTVEQGEGLWQVAQKELGDGHKWVEIAAANNVQKPYILTVGQKLTIPGKEVETVTGGPASYTLSQIAEHANKDNCWMTIEGKVYDVTPFVKSGFHPGRVAILEGCGKDATELFNTRPMGTGTPHSERARNMLPKYLIGELAP
jgi:cytochrome b involved in lipid metabolism